MSIKEYDKMSIKAMIVYNILSQIPLEDMPNIS